MGGSFGGAGGAPQIDPKVLLMVLVQMLQAQQGGAAPYTDPNRPSFGANVQGPGGMAQQYPPPGITNASAPGFRMEDQYAPGVQMDNGNFNNAGNIPQPY